MGISGYPVGHTGQAEHCIRHHAILAGAAGLIPAPGFDIAGVGAVQATMIAKLAEIHGVGIDFAVVKGLLTTMGGAALTQKVFSWLASAIKSLPGPGTLVGEVVQGVVSVSMTYAMGQAARLYFESDMKMNGTELQQAVQQALPEAREFALEQRNKISENAETAVVHKELEEIRVGLSSALAQEEEFFLAISSNMKDIAKRLEVEVRADKRLDGLLDESRKREKS
jgi:uncharacterized protein (DUF697 family)